MAAGHEMQEKGLFNASLEYSSYKCLIDVVYATRSANCHDFFLNKPSCIF